MQKSLIQVVFGAFRYEVAMDDGAPMMMWRLCRFNGGFSRIQIWADNHKRPTEEAKQVLMLAKEKWDRNHAG